MLTVLVLQLLSHDPQESYSSLPAEKLLEKRRVLAEERPSIAPPILLIALSPVVMGGAFAPLYVGVSGYNSCSWDKTSLCVAGAAGMVVGAAVLTFGLIWLFQRLSARTIIDARIQELTDLFEFRKVAPTPPPAP